MRGQLPNQPYFISLSNVETMISETHPIRVIKRMWDEVLASLTKQLDGICAVDGAPSIPPETLLKGKVLQALYTVRSDRQLCDRLKTDLLFRWFVDLPLDSEVFDASTYSKNQQRLFQHQIAELKANGFRPRTVGADKGYHNAGFIHGARQLGVVPHPALKQNQDSLRVRLTAPPMRSAN